MKIILDTKSLLVGILIASLGFLAMSTRSESSSDNGRFKAVIKDDIVILLNSENGDYLIATDLLDLRRNQWIKGEFYKTFKQVKDSTKK